MDSKNNKISVLDQIHVELIKYSLEVVYKEMVACIYIYIYIYDSQIVPHNPCFNLFILHDNSFDNQGREVNKNDILLPFNILSFAKAFFLLIYIDIYSMYMYILYRYILYMLYICI